MLIVGAGGHAKEVCEVLQLQLPGAALAFYDADPTLPDLLMGLPLLHTEHDAKQWLAQYGNAFALGTGYSTTRRKLYHQFMALGGKPVGCRAPTAIVGSHGIVLSDGVDVLHGVRLTTHVQVGTGTLLNAGCALHHDVRVGAFCSVSPQACLLGNVTLGDDVFIGAGAVVLQGLRIGDGATVGAGAVVTQDVPAGVTVAGVPAQIVSAKK
jgi:sugar O-acyltransferase (sialic acid O-acetyltransferase NeuD family)